MAEVQWFRNLVSVVLELLTLLCTTLLYYLETLFRIFVKPAPKSLAGEILLITGGANGIGKETVLQLAKINNSIKIIIWDLNEKAAEDVVNELKSLDCDARWYKVDVSDRSQVERTALKVRNEVGDVTILINNAGIMPCKNFFEHSPEELEKVFNINVFGNFWTIRAFVPQMITMNKGHVVTLCSAAGLIATRNLVPYCGTKHAVHALVEGIKDEFRSMKPSPNINFTTIYPYACNTGLLNGIKSYSRFQGLVPNALEPSDVAARIVEGLRRNYEHVYIPWIINICGNTARALPPKVQYATAEFLKCYVEPMD